MCLPPPRGLHWSWTPPRFHNFLPGSQSSHKGTFVYGWLPSHCFCGRMWEIEAHGCCFCHICGRWRITGWTSLNALNWGAYVKGWSSLTDIYMLDHSNKLPYPHIPGCWRWEWSHSRLITTELSGNSENSVGSWSMRSTGALQACAGTRLGCPSHQCARGWFQPCSWLRLSRPVTTEYE